MTLAGAAGETRAEMARVLHLDPAQETGASYGALQKSLGEISARPKAGGSEPVILSVANRLFAQKGFGFRPEFLARAKENFEAESELLDFRQNAGASEKINR